MIAWQPTRLARARIMGKFISVADALRTLRNYNTLMAILAGLNMSATHRLKHTVALLDTQYIAKRDALLELVSPSGSYKNLREAWQGAAGAVLPYLGVFLTDLTFIEDGNADVLRTTATGVPLINARKRAMVYETLAQVQLFQAPTRRYDKNIVRTEPLHTWLSALPAEHDARLYDMSLAREPRGIDESDVL